jgi:hypothetical protein
LFSLLSIFVSLQISTFRIDAKQAFPFRFISLRSENDGAPYLWSNTVGHTTQSSIP